MARTTRSADGVRIAYEVAGEGSPALVLVHGFACDRTYWHEQVPAFAPRHRVVTIDLAGHGDSEGGRPDWTMAAYGADVVAVVEACGLDAVVLVGHSMGGDVIAEAGPALGSRLRGLVWVDTYRSLGSPIDADEVAAIAEPFGSDFAGATRDLVRSMFRPDADSGLRDWIVEDMAAEPPDIGRSELVHAISNEPAATARLDELSAPLFAINPDYRPTDVESLREHGMEVVVVPDTGHFLMLEAPERFNAALAEVLTRIA